MSQVPSERQQRSVLVFGRGDVEDFELKGFDIAGRAIAALKDTRLVFVGAPEGKHEEIAQRLNRYGVPFNRLRVRGLVEDRESLKRLFQEVDLSHVFKNRRLSVDRTRGSFSWSSCGCQSQLGF